MRALEAESGPLGYGFYYLLGVQHREYTYYEYGRALNLSQRERGRGVTEDPGLVSL